MNYVYLAGPISGLSFGECTEWRDQVRKDAPYWIKTLSPMRSKEYLNEGDVKIKDSYSEYPMSTERAINTRDYNDVKRSAAILVNLLGATKVSIGTVMEIAYAKSHGVPVVTVMEPNNIHRHAMLNDASGFICETLEMGVDIIVSITGDDLQVKEYFKQKRKAKVIEMKSSPTKSGQVLPSGSELTEKQREDEARAELYKKLTVQPGAQKTPVETPYNKLINDYIKTHPQQQVDLQKQFNEKFNQSPTKFPWMQWFPDQAPKYMMGIDPCNTNISDCGHVSANLTRGLGGRIVAEYEGRPSLNKASETATGKKTDAKMSYDQLVEFITNNPVFDIITINLEDNG